MGSQTTKRQRTKHTVRTAIIAGSLIVAGCFTAAFTFAEETATAAERPVR
ncbi:hypothetical protein P8R33_10815 [Qipengyuania sp. XHP0211]|nr:hypothetical protein [Qipengyuania sp. XHP0211]MDG5751599.1 hypothetical protein [Qipengyuania sp. XHP0211]